MGKLDILGGRVFVCICFVLFFTKVASGSCKCIAATAGVTGGSVWQVLAELKDPELQRLANQLPETVLQSRADSTVKKYMAAFQRWERWAQARREVTVFPVNEVHLALYLQHLSEQTQSRSAVEEAVNAVSWIHQVSGLAAPNECAFVRMTLAGLKRKLAKPTVKKEPVTREMLSEMVASLSTNSNLSDVRTVASALLSFAAFLRYDEIARLRCCDLLITENNMEIRIISSKTDQYHMGDRVLVARTGNVTCPVKMME